MFRSQFKPAGTQQRRLRELCIFLFCEYVETWAVAHIAVKAPRSDINLFKKLESYQIINKKKFKAAFKKTAGRLWFLSKELVGLALFNDKLDNEKRGNLLKYATIDLELIHQMTLVDFTSKNAMILFKNMHLHEDFLKFPGDQWKHQSSFNDAKSFISSTDITNDYAERGISLIESFFRPINKGRRTVAIRLTSCC